MRSIPDNLRRYYNFLTREESEEEEESRVRALLTGLKFFILYFSIHTYYVVPKLYGGLEMAVGHARFFTGNAGIVVSLLAYMLFQAGKTRLAGMISSYLFLYIGIHLFIDAETRLTAPYVVFSIVGIGVMVSNLIMVVIDTVLFSIVSLIALVLVNTYQNALSVTQLVSHMIVNIGATTYTLVAIHHRRRMFSSLAIQKKRLVKQAKMASLGQMSGGIAHEINNPLAIVTGAVHNLKKMEERDISTRDKRLKFFEMIDQTSQRMAKIILGLKNFARDGSKDKAEFVYVSSILAETLVLSAQRAKKLGIRLLIDRYDESLQVKVRKIEIERVLLNLLNNAFDATKEEESKWVRVRVNKVPPGIEIDVVDSGVGVPDEIQRKILEPFFTTKPAGEGTGLGLSLSARVAEDHGGTLAYVNGLPFSTFRLFIPYDFEAPKIQRRKKKAA